MFSPGRIIQAGKDFVSFLAFYDIMQISLSFIGHAFHNIHHKARIRAEYSWSFADNVCDLFFFFKTDGFFVFPYLLQIQPVFLFCFWRSYHFCLRLKILKHVRMFSSVDPVIGSVFSAYCSFL